MVLKPHSLKTKRRQVDKDQGSRVKGSDQTRPLSYAASGKPLITTKTSIKSHHNQTTKIPFGLGGVRFRLSLANYSIWGLLGQLGCLKVRSGVKSKDVR